MQRYSQVQRTINDFLLLQGVDDHRAETHSKAIMDALHAEQLSPKRINFQRASVHGGKLNRYSASVSATNPNNETTSFTIKHQHTPSQYNHYQTTIHKD